MKDLFHNRFLVPIGTDNEKYFNLLNKYEKYIGGIFIGWPDAPSGRHIKTASKNFFDEIFFWCQEHGKIFDIVFNMQASAYYSNFDIEKINLSEYRNELVELTFASVILSKEMQFSGFKKTISVNYKINTIQQIHSLKKEIPDMHAFVVDRDINRDIRKIQKIDKFAKKMGLFMDMLIVEGCVPYCPNKIDHNIFVTEEHFHPETEKAMQKRSMELCAKYYRDSLSNILRTPFLTPEALVYYPARFFKISGRELPVENIDKILSYYTLRQPADIGLIFPVKKFLTGVMTDLLPKSFDKKILHCKNECHRCDFCEKTFKKMENKLS